MERFLARLRTTARRLLSTPVFTTAAAATLALAVASLTAAFAVADTLLLHPLPYPESDRLVEVGYAVPAYGFDQLPFSVGTFVATEERQRSLSDFAIYYDSDRLNVGLDDPERVPTARVTPGFFSVFRTAMARGRPFVEGDGRPGASPVAIVSHDLWRRRWGGDEELVGRSVYVEGVDYQIVGIAPGGFHYPDRRIGLWIPLTIDPANLAPMAFGYPGVGRLAPDVSVESADEDVRRITSRMSEVYPDNLTPQWVEGGGFDSYVRPLREKVVGGMEAEVWTVLGTAGLLLLLAAANIANLFLVRAEGRSRDLAMRRALGADRAHLLVESLTESVLVSATGGVVGLLLATVVVRLVVRHAPPDLMTVAVVGMGADEILFGLALALVAGLVFGVIPMWGMKPTSVHAALRAGPGSSTGTPRARFLLTVLMGNQVALAVALLVGAGLLAQSARNLGRVDPGFVAADVMTFEIGLPENEYDAGRRADVWQLLVDNVAEMTSVEAVGAAEFLPLSTDFRKGPLHVEGQDLPEGEAGPLVDLKRVTPGYFAAMGIPVIEGRGIEPGDGPGGYPTVVANQTLVDRFLGGGPALGRRVMLTRRGEYSEIVGVVGDVRTESFRRDPLPFLYYPQGTMTPSSAYVPTAMMFAVRSPVPAAGLVPTLAQAVAGVDPKLPLGSPRSLDSIVAEHLARQRLVAGVLLGMAFMGLVLAALGVYGVIAYVAVRRRREMGVRMALGASRATLLGGIVGRTMAVTAAGAVAGAAVAFVASRYLASVVFGVAPDDPLTYGAALALVVAAAMVGSWAPAWRVSRLDPLEILREE